MMRISKKFITETSHIVREAVSLRCRNSIHGHSYLWIVSIEGELNGAGMVLDFKELSPVKQFIDLFDHASVFWSKEDSEIVDFFKCHFDRVLVMKKNPTAENMARLVFCSAQDWFIAKKLDVKVAQVDVWETATGCGIANECDENDILIYTHTDCN